MRDRDRSTHTQRESEMSKTLLLNFTKRKVDEKRIKVFL